jgi:hypothetical protein
MQTDAARSFKRYSDFTFQKVRSQSSRRPVARQRINHSDRSPELAFSEKCRSHHLTTACLRPGSERREARTHNIVFGSSFVGGRTCENDSCSLRRVVVAAQCRTRKTVTGASPLDRKAPKRLGAAPKSKRSFAQNDICNIASNSDDVSLKCTLLSYRHPETRQRESATLFLKPHPARFKS